MGVLEGLLDGSLYGNTLSLVYGTLQFTAKIPLLGYLITNILGDLEPNPLGESDTISEGD